MCTALDCFDFLNTQFSLYVSGFLATDSDFAYGIGLILNNVSTPGLQNDEGKDYGRGGCPTQVKTEI